MQSTKKRLLAGSVALILCIALLLGSTLAWFTASVSNTGNVIETGDLEVEMYWSESLLAVDSDEWKDASGAPIFTYDNWEPGYTDVKYIRITNKGDLNLKWKLTVEAGGTVSELADVIDVYYVNPVTEALTSVAGLTGAGNLTKVLRERVNASGALIPQQSTVMAIAFHMQEGAGNQYENLSLCENGFTLKLIAAQDVGESGALGDDYDADAEWSEDTVNFAASTEIDSSNLLYGALASEVVVGADNGISATIPANVQVAEGATSLALSVKSVETDSNITVGEGEAAKSLDVHIEGIAVGNTVPMKVNLGAILAPGLSETEVKLYHTENGTPVLMTPVDSADDFTCHNQYTYDPATGEVCIYVATFSVFSVLQTAADLWDGTYDLSWYNGNATTFTLTTAEQFAGFRAIVDGGYYDAQWNRVEVTQDSFAGKTVILGKDIDLNNLLFDPIGYNYANKGGQVFMGTFDGGNHTVYNLYQNCWELDPDKQNYTTYTYSTAGAGLFASIQNATIKDLVVSGAEIVFECVDMGVVVGYAQGVCHFENIVVTDSNIANYNRYTGGVVGEVSYGPYGTDTTQGYSHTFKNVVVDSSVKVSGLWGSFGCGMGGVIGGKWGDATVKMENVISAAEMDVFNDVVSAYQWYAFRGCGMLIGHTEEPYSDGRHSGNATAGFLTCENVKVYYGAWVNQTYYEFANQDSATGRSYPWVRAEVGEYNEAFSNIRYGVPTHNGVKVTAENCEEFSTDVAHIVFDQLYGADRGMYGTAAHEGVTVIRDFDPSVTKTVHVVNHNGSDNLKLQYWFKKGTEIWTANTDGIDMSHMVATAATYNIILPAYADGFSILSGDQVLGTFLLADLAEGTVYNIDGNVHAHAYTNGICACGHACAHTGGSATCTTLATCTVCGMSYGSYGGHSLYWANDNESYCYQKCYNCSHSQGTTSHSWSGSACSQCGRTQTMIGSVSDTDIAYGFDSTISFAFNGGSKAASNYDVYIMQGGTALLGQDAVVGTMTFNVTALGVGSYNIVVVDATTGQWVAAVTSAFQVRDTGLQKKWTAVELYNATGNVSGCTKSATSDGLLRLTCDGTFSENQMRLIVDANGGTSYGGGYLVIKYRNPNSSSYNNVEVIPSINGAWANGSGVATGSSNGSNMYIGTGGALSVTPWNYQNWNTMDGLILDFFIGVSVPVGTTIDIEYIAFATDPNYIGNN